MNKTEFKKHAKIALGIDRTKGFNLSITKTCDEFFAYPFRGGEANSVIPSAAYVARVENTDSEGVHNVVITYSKKRGYDFFCGDSFLEGGAMIAENMSSIMEKFRDGLVGHGLNEECMLELESEAQEQFDAWGKSTGCHFWQSWKKNMTFCKHVAKVLAVIHANDYEEIDRLKNYFDSHILKSKPAGKLMDQFEVLAKTLDHYAFSKHMIVEGCHGSGKTYACTRYLESKNVIRFDGHAGVEAADFKGYLIPYADETGAQKVIWQDGPLSQAFRQAASGVPTVLFIDEIGRIPPDQLSVLVGALTKDGTDHYNFNTGRVINCDGQIAQMEILRAPIDMLWVCGTTNVGVDYNVASFEKALADRFRFFRLDSDYETVKLVLNENCKAKKFKARLANSLAKLYQKLSLFKAQGALTNEPNLRHFVEIIQLAKDEDDIYDEIKRTQSLWVGKTMDNGSLIQDEVDAVDKAIKAAL